MSKPNGKEVEANDRKKLELPMLALPGAHPCHDCGSCCNYVAVEIDNPTGFKDYEQIYWYLTHGKVAVYVDWEGDWYIEFATVCEHLNEAKACGIYQERPWICSDFSSDECEKTTNEPAFKYRFETPEELSTWHRERRPRSYERYVRARKKFLAQRSGSAPRPQGGARRGAGSESVSAEI